MCLAFLLQAWSSRLPLSDITPGFPSVGFGILTLHRISVDLLSVVTAICCLNKTNKKISLTLPFLLVFPVFLKGENRSLQKPACLTWLFIA